MTDNPTLCLLVHQACRVTDAAAKEALQIKVR